MSRAAAGAGGAGGSGVDGTPAVAAAAAVDGPSVTTRSPYLLQPVSRCGDVANGERHDARLPEALVEGRASESPASANGRHAEEGSPLIGLLDASTRRPGRDATVGVSRSGSGQEPGELETGGCPDRPQTSSVHSRCLSWRRAAEAVSSAGQSEAAREAELLALASLHSVSMLDPSFLHGKLSQQEDTLRLTGHRTLSSGGPLVASEPEGERDVETERGQQRERVRTRQSETELSLDRRMQRLQRLASSANNGAGSGDCQSTFLSESFRKLDEEASNSSDANSLSIREVAGESKCTSSHSAASARSREAWWESGGKRAWEMRAEAILDLLLKNERERQQELEVIAKARAVSDFAYRSQLQSLLRGRSLSPEGSDGPRPAAEELGDLQRRRAVTGLREGFRYRLETIIQNQPRRHSERRQDEAAAPWRTYRGRAGAEGGRARALPRRWPDRPEGADSRRLSGQATDSMSEIRELLARRSVSSTLASEFRAHLDELIHTLIQRQPRGGQASHILDEAGNRPPPPPPPPPPPVPRSLARRIWPGRFTAAQMEGNVSHDSREREGRAALVEEVRKVTAGLEELRAMFSEMMVMQLELQRCVRQELSSALHGSSTSRGVSQEAQGNLQWELAKVGTCSVCCDKDINCLLYRCGHMCTCHRCAQELLARTGRCPMCRAPIVEVVRAFTPV
eukprot:SM000233S07975  [mRNA]  locus=s233:198343:201954:+ [translate_table: standard]